jgi:hypothetical protein
MWNSLYTGAYFGGRAYITSSLKNHAWAYFSVRSYFRGNTVLTKVYRKCATEVYILKNVLVRVDPCGSLMVKIPQRRLGGKH